MSEQLFAVMRFQILAAALTPGSRDRLANAYVYAWDVLVYPFHHEAAGWHKPFAEHFRVTKQMIEELADYLDKAWTGGTVPTFYDLEKKYEVRSGSGDWERHTLIQACRYIALCNLFDAAFWRTLLTPREHPSEAGSLNRPYDRDNDLYFH